MNFSTVLRFLIGPNAPLLKRNIGRSYVDIHIIFRVENILFSNLISYSQLAAVSIAANMSEIEVKSSCLVISLTLYCRLKKNDK